MTAETAEILDEYARNLLAELATNARASYADLGRRVGLSPSAVAERMRRMEEDGVIKGYGIEIDPAILGLPVLAVIRMTCDGTHYHPFLKFVKTLNEVRLCHHVTGADAFYLEIATSSLVDLERLIERLLPYGIPTTSLVFSSPVVRRGPDLTRLNPPKENRRPKGRPR
ncbi:Lrp/AsnC family leucine-responsive transcriptional regulator [Silvibacterium bohemicum]|uniref:Lrp/AsnC family leucine-responsive transcriptional regulator n=1 Tax=Silvibacterium bohemicum TaxID=1577686 RepID=A0A841JXC2_9BACT|nr:Lrp/AsnC family transcriptional regulator [Silvibacterium bohemicum]MBB6146006.1 Lrp/AsnC family leucine-responsive transcriptional regulator [Silvibacterium bohemicum]